MELDINLRRERLYEQVADELEKLIVDDTFSPDQRLPSERALAERLAVSRSVIREALRVLTVRRLVDIKPGSGAYVQRLSRADAAESLVRYIKQGPERDRFFFLGQVRYPLEIEIAGLAAAHAAETDIERLEAALANMEAHSDEPEAFVKHDLEFHLHLAEATRNDLFLVILAPLADLQLEFRQREYTYDAEEAVRGALTHHRRILDCVRAGDPECARRAMADHLEQAEAMLRRSHSGDSERKGR